MHGWDASSQALADSVVEYAVDRLRLDPVPLDHPRTPEELDALVGGTITEGGRGGPQVMEMFEDVIAKSCLSIDHPRYLAFIPCAPTRAATLFDLVVSAASIYGGSWLEGSGAVHAENQALRWVADLAGFPAEAGGVFVQGGTIGNLSALVAARDRARRRLPLGTPKPRWKIAATTHAHSSIAAACDVMDVDLLAVPVDDEGRLTGAALSEVLEREGTDGLFAVVATAGTTNFGIVDDLASVADVCEEHGVWMHVDGAYGAAGLLVPELAPRYAGFERADSFVVDPHKWLFAPFDCCALIYRDPVGARAAHTQRAGYLDVLTEAAEVNPSDYAVGLTRRARGLPFWFSLAVHGTAAYREAVVRTLEVARHAAAVVRETPHLELLREPDLSVVVFRRTGWTPRDYQEWSGRLLDEGLAFVVPTSHDGETVARFAIVNPRTQESDVEKILDTMA